MRGEITCALRLTGQSSRLELHHSWVPLQRHHPLPQSSQLTFLRSRVPPCNSPSLKGMFTRGASLVAQLVKESTCNAGDPSSISGSERSPGEGNGYPLQYSGLENSMDCRVHRITKSQTQLSDFHTQGHVWCQPTSIQCCCSTGGLWSHTTRPKPEPCHQVFRQVT